MLRFRERDQRRTRSQVVHEIVLFLLVFVVVSHQGVQSCGFPGSPAHAKVHTSDDRFREGTVVTFECDPGYRMLGRSSLRCVNSEWDSPGLPYCVREVAFRKPTRMSSRNATAALAVDDDRNTCAETAFGHAHRWSVDLLEEHVVVSVVEVHFGMELKNATVTITVADHRTNMSSLCTRWRGIDLDDDGTRYFSCGSGEASKPGQRGSSAGRADDVSAITGIAEEIGISGRVGGSKGRYVSIFVEAAHGFSLRLCEIGVFSQELLSPEDVCGEAGGKIESFEGMCYEATPHEMLFDEAVEHCSKRGGRLWPATQGNSMTKDDMEDDRDAILEDQRIEQKAEERFISWMMDVHNLGRVWAAPREDMPGINATTSPISVTTTTASTIGTSKPAPTSSIGPSKNDAIIQNDSSETRPSSWETPIDPDEMSRSFLANELDIPSNTANRTCGVFLPSRGMRGAVQYSQDTPCGEAVFGLCVRPTRSCGRPALPKRMASWISVGSMAPGEVFSKFECEQGYYVSGPASVRCGKRGTVRQQMATQCRSSMCGAPPLVDNSFVVLDTTRPHLRCVNDSYILHGRAHLHCNPLAARWDRPRAVCIHLPMGARYNDKGLVDKLGQGIELFPVATRAGVIMLLVSLLFLKVLISVAFANLVHFFHVVKPRLDRKAGSTSVLSKIHEELKGDIEHGLSSKTPPSGGGHLRPQKRGTTDELELSSDDVLVISRPAGPEDGHNKSQKNSSSTPKAPETPKLRLYESPIEELR